MKRVPVCRKGRGPHDIRNVTFAGDHSAATVTLNNGATRNVTLQFSRKHPHGVYKDVSGRIYMIG